MISRIELILKTQNLSPTQFADTIGIQRPTMSHILARRNNPSLDFVTKVLNRFPEISSEWLLTGKGQMLKLGTSLPSADAFQSVQNNLQTPEFEWNNESKQDGIILPQTQFAEQPEMPPKSVASQYTHTASNEKILPEKRQDSNQNSDIERIIVFFADGTFKSYT